MNKKLFYIFITLNAFVWTIVESLRHIISIDSMEAVHWGQLISFGTNKHPPLSGWLAGSFYGLFNDHNIGIYILGQLCIIVGLIYIYKLAKQFLNEEKAICSSLIITTSFYYTFQVFYDNFNCNIIMMAITPVMLYYFYKAIKCNEFKYWSLLGIIIGLALLTKYQVVIVLFSMFLYSIFYERQIFCKKRTYFAILLALLIISPHLIWLYKTNLFSLTYFLERTKPTECATLICNILNRIWLPVKFYLDQILALAPCLAIYLIFALKEKNISFKPIDIKNKNDAFILFIGLLPVILIGLSGTITSSRVVGAWGVSMVSYMGLILFYCFPVEFKKNSFKIFIQFIACIIIIWQISMTAFAILQTKTDMGFPYKKITTDFNATWIKNTNTQTIKYVAGDNDFAFAFALYNNPKTKLVLDTYGHKNPWIKTEDILKYGILIIAYDQERLKYFMQNIIPRNNNVQIQKYNFVITNKFNKSKNYEVYYVIVPPNTKLNTTEI